jgi:selenocysteine lyase/cysteine desulfurase
MPSDLARFWDLDPTITITPWPLRPRGSWRRLVRVSLAPYNDRGDVDVLADAIGELHAARP